MIPSAVEIQRSIRGALRLAQRDPDGMNEFNLSFEGFYQSFFAAILSAPAFAFLTARQYQTEHTPPIGSILISETIGYAIGWLAFPVAAIFLTRLFGLGSRYIPLVVAGNWASFIQSFVFLAASLFSGLFGSAGAPILLFATVIAVIAYEWYVVQTALQTTVGIAASFVAVDFILNVLINGLSQVLLRS